MKSYSLEGKILEEAEVGALALYPSGELTSFFIDFTLQAKTIFVSNGILMKANVAGP